jgi:PI-3-kinase-related kinase SMG-1
VPEKVPFRLTENIKTAFGLTGVEGTFRLSCEQVLKTLRRGRETLLTLLEAFVYDPLVDWTTGNDEIFTAEQTDKTESLRAKTQLSDKKEMERGITQALLHSRVAEMRAAWKKNKMDVSAEFQRLLDCTNAILSLQLQQKETVGEINRIHGQSKMLQNIVATGKSHPVFHAQARCDTHQRLSREQEDALSMVRDKKAESERWQAKHEDTLGRMYSGELQSLQSEASHAISIDQTGCIAATEFLTNTGQGHLITQCCQCHSELVEELHKRHDAVNSCLASLECYEQIIRNFSAAKFVSINRSMEWHCLFDSLLSHLNSSTCSTVLKTYMSNHPIDAELPCLPAVQTKLLAVHRGLHMSLVEENTKLSKLVERRPPDIDVSKLEQIVDSCTTTLHQLLSSGQHAVTSLCCIAVSALSTLNSRWLVMEKTAMDAGERLHELRSRDGDWFLDELLTMSLNVSQMVELLQTLPLNEAAGKASEEGFQAVIAATPVYEALQELVHKVQSCVAPQLVEALLADKPGLEDVIQPLETADKAMTSQQAHQELTSGFGSGMNHADLLLDLARESYMELLQSSSGVYAQVLNMLDQLFGAVEYALADLSECIQQQSAIPPQYINIPVVKETTALSVSNHRQAIEVSSNFVGFTMVSMFGLVCEFRCLHNYSSVVVLCCMYYTSEVMPTESLNILLEWIQMSDENCIAVRLVELVEAFCIALAQNHCSH